MKVERDKPINIKDIAREAGVAISTVSHTINGTKFVSTDIKERVNKTIKRLNYEVNPLASSLKTKSTKTIGILITNINSIFFPQIIKGIQSYCSKLGYNLTLCDTDHQFEKEKYYIQTLRSYWVDGIILGSVAEESERDYLDTISRMVHDRKPIPFVSLERKFEDYPISSVTVDNYKGGIIATRYLLNIGCRKIAHITGPKYSSITRLRMNGYIDSLKEQHLKPIIAEGDFSPISGYQAIANLLNTYGNIDGIFAANDQMAIGALRNLKEHGFNVPEEVKIVGFDNTFIASIVNPSLTTINVPKFEMGVSAAKLLIERIDHPDTKPVNTNLPIDLIVRQSTGLKIDNDWELSEW